MACKIKSTYAKPYRVHINAVSIGPCMLKGLL